MVFHFQPTPAFFSLSLLFVTLKSIVTTLDTIRFSVMALHLRPTTRRLPIFISLCLRPSLSLGGESREQNSKRKSKPQRRAETQR